MKHNVNVFTVDFYLTSFQSFRTFALFFCDFSDISWLRLHEATEEEKERLNGSRPDESPAETPNTDPTPDYFNEDANMLIRLART